MEKILDPITKLSFSVSSFVFTKCFKLVISFVGDALIVSYNSKSLHAANVSEKRLPDYFLGDIQGEIATWHIDQWKDYYQPEGYITLDGESWQLDLEYENGNKRSITGENAYPVNFKKLRKLIKRIVIYLTYDKIPVYEDKEQC